MSKFDTKPVLKKSVDDIVASFADYDDAQLKALHDAESGEGGQKRSTLLGAIHSEQSTRELNAATKAAIDDAASKGVKLYSQSDVDALKADHGKRIADIEAKLAAAEGATPARAVSAEPRKLALTGEADERAYRVAFTGEDDVTLNDLPELEFGPADFDIDRASQALVLTQPIRFPESAIRREVSKVWLVDDSGKAAAVAELVNPLTIGGGTSASIPKGFLAFRRPAGTQAGKTEQAA